MIKQIIIVKGENNPIMGNIVTCEIFSKKGINEAVFRQKVKEYCKKRLKKYKIPAKININYEGFMTDRMKRRRYG